MQSLRLKLPEDKESFEKELMNELDIDKHEEIKRLLDRLSDVEKIALFTRLLKKKKAKKRYLEEEAMAYASAPRRDFDLNLS